MSFLRIFGFSRGSRNILFTMVPFVAIAVFGTVANHLKGEEGNPAAELLFLVVLNLLSGAALTGLLLGLIGGFKRDEEPALGKICAVGHIVLLAILAGATSLLFV